MSHRVPTNGELGGHSAPGRTSSSRGAFTVTPGVPQKNRSTRTALSIVANHCPSLTMRRAARWLKGLTRDQSVELNSIVSWIICVYYFSAFTLSYKTSDFVTYARWVCGYGDSDAADLCGLCNFFTSFLASTLCSYEAYAGWGTPKGRGAHAAYCRKATRRQILLLLIMTTPSLASNWFACKLMRSLTTHGQREARASVWATLAVGFRHGIANTNPPGLVSFFIITSRFIGDKVSHGFLWPTLTELVWDIVVPNVIAERTAQYFMRRDLQWYGGLSAERSRDRKSVV